MSSAADTSDPDDLSSPARKRRRTSAQLSTSDAPSGTSSAVREMTRAQRLETYDDPWSYTHKQVQIIEELADIDLLRQAQVVPDYAHINAQANRIQLVDKFHQDLDNGLVDSFPHRGQVVARVLCEIKYQDERVAASSSGTQGEATVTLPVRPPFQKFYADAEKVGACFRLVASSHIETPYIVRYDQPGIPTLYALEGIVPDDPLRLLWFKAKKVPAGAPILPPLIVPISMNLLIWAMRDRIRRSPPSPLSVRQEASILAHFIDLLLEFWFLNDQTPSADISELVGRARVFVKDHGGAEWADLLSNLGNIDYADITKGVTLPDNAVRSQDPPPRPEERARTLALDLAFLYDDDEDVSDSRTNSDLSEQLDYPVTRLPSHLAADPSQLLTAAALENLESQTLTAAALENFESPPLPFASPRSPKSFDSTSLIATPSPAKEAHTPALSHAASSSLATSSPSLAAPVVASLAAHGVQPAKVALMSSWFEKGPYLASEETTEAEATVQPSA